jgi:hypothetical protein
VPEPEDEYIGYGVDEAAKFQLPVTVGGGPGGLNAAVTEVAVESPQMQLPVPLQPPPDQPAKLDPPVGEAVKVTELPLTYDTAQNAPQFILPSALVTVPVPVPECSTVRT